MALTITRVDSPFGSAFGNKMKSIFNVAISGSYVSGGDTLDFTTAAANVVGTSQPPLSLGLMSGDLKGYQTDLLVGTALSNSKFKVYTAVNTELAAGAYPAALLNQVFQVEAEFTKY